VKTRTQDFFAIANASRDQFLRVRMHAQHQNAGKAFPIVSRMEAVGQSKRRNAGLGRLVQRSERA